MEYYLKGNLRPNKYRPMFYLDLKECIEGPNNFNNQIFHKATRKYKKERKINKFKSWLSSIQLMKKN